MTFTGDLNGLSMADVFQNIAGNRTSGTLRVEGPRGERFVRFEQGRVAGYAPGRAKPLPIFDHVIERGHADTNQVELLRDRRRSRRSPGQQLLKAGVVDKEILETALCELVAEGAYDLLVLKEAKFDFTEGDAPPDIFDPDLNTVEVRLEVGPLLLEGARRADEWQRIRTVIGGDADLFVADPQAANMAQNDLQASVAQMLDGRTDLAAICAHLHHGRFEVAAAMAALVQQGLARPATGEEIASLATDALNEGDQKTAIRMLGSALTRRPRDADLRRQLARSLEAAGRPGEAAGELAMLAFQAIEEERFTEALPFLERAISLHPADVALHERRCEVLQNLGDRSQLASGLLQWADRLETLGLLDRARGLLTQHADDGPLRNHPRLLQRLAELGQKLGNLPEASARWQRLAELHAERDPERELRCLRAALKATPDDEALERRIADIESGRTQRLRRRRRILIWSGAAALLLGLCLWSFLAELSASHRLSAILSESDDPLRVQTLSDLRQLGEDHPWLPSGRDAASIAADRAQIALQHGAALRLELRYDEALQVLTAAAPSLPEALRQRAHQLQRRLRDEQQLAGWFKATELSGTDDGEACEGLARATGPEHLAFHIDLLPLARSDATRRSILRALQGQRDPRLALPATRVLIATSDSGVAGMAEGVLIAAAEQDPAAAQSALGALLQQARRHPETRKRAERALEVLSTRAAVPDGR